MSEFTEPLGIGGKANAYWRSQDGGQYALEIVGTDDCLGRSVVVTSIGIMNGVSALHFHRARGTKDSPEPVQNGDILMSIGLRAWDGEGFAKSSAAIQAYAAQGSDGKALIGAYFDFEVTQVNAAVREKAMRIAPNRTLRLFAYGAGVLMTDVNGNVVSDNALLDRIASIEARLSALEGE